MVMAGMSADTGGMEMAFAPFSIDVSPLQRLLMNLAEQVCLHGVCAYVWRGSWVLLIMMCVRQAAARCRGHTTG